MELCYKIIDNQVMVGYSSEIDLGGIWLKFSYSGYKIDSLKLLQPALNMELHYGDTNGVLRVAIYSFQAHIIPKGTDYFLSIYLNEDGTLQLDTASASNARGTANLNVEQVPCSQLGPDTTSSIPRTFFLYQNYPNPFNYYTTIPYELKYESSVQIDIFNIKGQIVRDLLYSTKNRGFLSIGWNGKGNKGNRLPSGVYLCKMKVKNQTQTIKLLLLK
jgi:hypothetical protein